MKFKDPVKEKQAIRESFFFVCFVLIVAYVFYSEPKAPVGSVQKKLEPIAYTIDSESVNEFKSDYYYTITLNVPEGRKPTDEEMKGIFHSFLKPYMKKLVVHFMLPRMIKNAGDFANCFKLKDGSENCYIPNEYNEQGGEKIKLTALKLTGKELDWCAMSGELFVGHLESVHYADKIVPSLITEADSSKHQKIMNKKSHELEEKIFKKFKINRGQYNALWVELNKACNY